MFPVSMHHTKWLCSCIIVLWTYAGLERWCGTLILFFSFNGSCDITAIFPWCQSCWQMILSVACWLPMGIISVSYPVVEASLCPWVTRTWVKISVLSGGPEGLKDCFMLYLHLVVSVGAMNWEVTASLSKNTNLRRVSNKTNLASKWVKAPQFHNI